MSIETITETNRSPGVVPAAAWRVSAVSVQSGYRLALSFVDGTSGVAEFSRLVNGKDAGIFSALSDPALFEQVRIDLGVITWPNGAEIDPDWLHEEIRTHGQWLVSE